MSLLMRDLSPFELQEEIMKLLLNQHLAQRGRPASMYPPGGTYAPASRMGMLPAGAAPLPPLQGNLYAAPMSPEAVAFAQPPGAGWPSPQMPVPDGGEDIETGDEPGIIPALYDPDEDQLPDNPFDACKDRCFQAFRRDARDCYKKRGKLAKALCFAQAASKQGSCIGDCGKYRQK